MVHLAVLGRALRAAHAECAILAGETDWGSRLLSESAEMPLRDEAPMFRVGLLLAAAPGDARARGGFDSGTTVTRSMNPLNARS